MMDSMICDIHIKFREVRIVKIFSYRRSLCRYGYLRGNWEEHYRCQLYSKCSWIIKTTMSMTVVVVGDVKD